VKEKSEEVWKFQTILKKGKNPQREGGGVHIRNSNLARDMLNCGIGGRLSFV